MNQKVAIRALEKFGCLVTVAGNGLEAVAAFEKSQFDLILMDIQMPEMGGFEATAKVCPQSVVQCSRLSSMLMPLFT